MPSSFEVKTVLPLLRAWQGPSDEPYGVDKAKYIIQGTLNATVHAEAALMQYMAAVEVRFPCSPKLQVF